MFFFGWEYKSGITHQSGHLATKALSQMNPQDLKKIQIGKIYKNKSKE